MIMKRKLPSQTEKLDEDLLEEEKKSDVKPDEQQSSKPTSPQSEASGGSAGGSAGGGSNASSHGGAGDGETKQQSEEAATRKPDAPKDTGADDKRPQNSDQSTQKPGSDDITNDDILDPFVHSDDDDDMTRTSPPQRPQNTLTQDASQHPPSVPPRKHQVSTQALLGGGNTQEKTQQSPAQQEFEPENLSQQNSSKPDLSRAGLSGDDFSGDNFSKAGNQQAKPAADKENTTPAAPSRDETYERLDPDVGPSHDTEHASEYDGDTWDLGDLVEVPNDASDVGVTPFASKSDAPDADPDQEDVAPPPDAPPPWKRKATHDDKNHDGKNSHKKKKSFTPKLPKTAQVSASKTGAIMSLFLVALLIGGTALLYQNRDVAVEVISRWTGTLGEVGQPVPEEAPPQVSPQANNNAPDKQSPNAPSGREGSAATFQARNNPTSSPQKTEGVNAQNDDNINLDVLDVPADKANEPIVGDDNVNMPEDIDKFSSLQKAIAEKRAERQKETSAKLPGEEEAADPSRLSPEEMTRRNAKIIRKTNNTLAEYRQALADVDDPALKPRPGQFMEGRRQGNNNQLPPPNQNGRGQDASGQQNKPQLYGNKVVSNLSELIEQKKQKENNVRTLDDFEVALFNPRRKEVSIPKGITPRLTKESFPPLEVLSFVPNQGIIAKAKEQQGVLLLGETLEGWELIQVKSDYAEFQKNGQKRIVTFNHANR